MRVFIRNLFNPLAFIFKDRIEAMAEKALDRKIVSLFPELTSLGTYAATSNWRDYSVNFRECNDKVIKREAASVARSTCRKLGEDDYYRLYDDRGDIRASLVDTIIAAVNKKQLDS